MIALNVDKIVTKQMLVIQELCVGKGSEWRMSDAHN